jgi:hypothetical protein
MARKRMAPSFDMVPHSVERYLLPHERQVLTVRMHPVSLMPALTMATGGLLAAIAVGPAEKGDGYLALATWLLEGVLVAQLGIVIISWLNRFLAVTSQRIMLVAGGPLRRGLRLNMPLSQMQDVRLVRSPGGRVYGYGTLVWDSVNIALRYLPYPEQLYLELAGLIYKDPGEGDD